MSVQPLSPVSFKGRVNVLQNQTVYGLETDKILAMESRGNDRTLVKYDFPKEVRHNGYTTKEPITLDIKQDINTILNAYNAAKNSDVVVDIADYNA